MRMAARLASNPLTPEYAGVAEFSAGHNPRWLSVKTLPERLGEPLRWKRPRRVFVTSMSDIFHDAVPTEFIDQVFAVMALTPRHTYQQLTKRPEDQLRYILDPETPYRVQKAMDAIEVDLDMEGIKEEWRPVVGWAEYEVPNYGNVRREGKMLAQANHPRSYLQVALCSGGEPKTRPVHVIVLRAFRGVPDEALETRHRNGNRADNRLANLSWGSKTENMQDAARHGTAGVWMKGRSTLTPAQVTEIRRRRVAGDKLDDIAVAFGSTRQQVSAIALGKIFKPARLTWPLPNVHVGVSAEDQATADERIPLLLQTPAALRWVSIEPMLGAIDLDGEDEKSLHALGCGYEGGPWRMCPDLQPSCTGIDWCVVGSESGPGPRPMHRGPGPRPMRLEWVRSIRDQCVAAGVPLFVKQLSGKHGKTIKKIKEFPADLQIQQYPEGGP